MSLKPSPRLVHTIAPLLLALGVAGCKEKPAPEPPRERPGKLRPARHAGSWYPSEAASLRGEIDKRLRAAPVLPSGPPVIGMIGPHAGLRFSGSVVAAGYAALAKQNVRRVILLGPSHHVPFTGIALPAADLRGYATPLGDLLIDHEAIDTLRPRPGFAGPSQAHLPEHSLEMHAIFIAAVMPGARLVPLVVGQLGTQEQMRAIATSIRRLLRPGDVVVVSSDFTHYGPRYGYVPFTDDTPNRLARLLDDAAAPIVARDLAGFEAHLNATQDTICGREPIRLLLAMLPDDATGVRVTDDSSGRQVADFSNSVTYMTALFRRRGGWPAAEQHGFMQGPPVLDGAGRAVALRMARKTLETYLTDGRVPEPDELGVPAGGPLRETYGAFVTLNKNGHLRGCIGHIFPVQPLWRDIRDNAISAAVADHRFEPVTASELAQIEVEISVLTPPEDIPGPADFEIGRHGIVLAAGGRRAVYLPQVAPEQGWDRDTTLTYLSRKAGLPLDAWRSPQARFQVFEAQVFAETQGTH